MAQSIAQTANSDVLKHIFSFLDERDRSQAAATCRHWKNNIYDYRRNSMRAKAYEFVIHHFAQFPYILRDLRKKI